MMTKTKKKITFMVILIALMMLMPIENIQAKSKSPAKLGAKDFSYTLNGKKKDFFKESKNDPTFFYCTYKIIDKKNVTGDVDGFRTNRKIKTGNTESYVKKQYGSATKIKVNKKDILYKYYKYEWHGIDISSWKSYLDYSYKKGSNQYKIRFYLDKKNKVTAIILIKNLSNFFTYPNKEVKCGMSFKTPKGKKVTTKKINGKTVYLLPKGTKIGFGKGGSMPSLKRIYPDIFLIYNKYGKTVNGIRGVGDSCAREKNYDPEKIFKMIGVNDYKSNKYLYNVITFAAEGYAPYVFYFKIV